MKLAEIWCYPVKSCAGISLASASVGPRGILYDRHWMLVDADGVFLTQRQLPRMALIRPELRRDRLRLEAPDRPVLEVPYDQAITRTEIVQIWQDRCEATAVGETADRWFSDFLGAEAHLVFLPEGSRRPVSRAYAGPDDEVGLADGFPFLLIGRGSLDDLASRMGTELAMRRFRPNLVIEGCAPYAEDGWRRVRVGGLGFRVVKPCSRCAITTVNPDTGDRDLDTLGALAAYRKRDNKVYFGQNLIHDAVGELAVGDPVEVAN